MKTTVKLTGLLLAFVMMLSAISVSVVPASAITPLPIVMQNDYKWTGAANTYGSGTLMATGCGIFSLVNAVGYLTGKAMDVNEVAAWAYSIGAYNAGGADGTYRFELYPYVEARYGAKYGFTLDCNGTQGWWQGSSSTILKNHLAGGGVAIGHVPGHFIALVGYDSSKTYSYHIYDSYPTNSRNTYPGDVWVTQSHLATGSLKLDWFCLLSLDSSSISSGPSINVATTVDHNTPLSVSWGAVNNALSYKYKVERYDGEMSGSSAKTIVAETATTGTSFTIPAQSTGKYYKVTVTAVGEKDSKSSTAIVMVGPWSTYPTTVQYIPVNEINGTVTTSNSCILTYDFTSSMTFKYWRGFLLTPNSDGTYTVGTIYENGTEKTIDISSNNLIFMMHSAYDRYQYAQKIVVGDKLTLCGIYVDKNTIRGSGYILVNGGVSLAVGNTSINAPAEVKHGETATVSWSAAENATSYNYKVTNGSAVVMEQNGATETSITIPAQTSGTSLTVTVTAVGPLDTKTVTKTITLKSNAPADITSSETEVQKVEGSNTFRGFEPKNTAQTVLDKFDQDNEYLEIRKADGTKIATTDLVATGYTVNVVVNGSVTVTYELVVNGDINGDANVNAADYISMRQVLKNLISLKGAYDVAVDYNCDGMKSAMDYIALRSALAQ